MSLQVVQALASIKGQGSDYEVKIGRLEGTLQLMQADIEGLKVCGSSAHYITIYM